MKRPVIKNITNSKENPKSVYLSTGNLWLTYKDVNQTLSKLEFVLRIYKDVLIPNDDISWLPDATTLFMGISNKMNYIHITEEIPLHELGFNIDKEPCETYMSAIDGIYNKIINRNSNVKIS